MAGIIFDLPAFVRADLLALGSAARAGALLRAQFVNVRGDGEVLEIGEIAPALAPPHAPQFIGRLGRGRNVVRMNRLAVQFLGEGEQHLRHLAARLQPVRARAVIPLLETLQFELKPQHLDAEFLGLPASLRSSARRCCCSARCVSRSRSRTSERTIAFSASLSSGKLTNSGVTYKWRPLAMVMLLRRAIFYALIRAASRS